MGVFLLNMIIRYCISVDKSWECQDKFLKCAKEESRYETSEENVMMKCWLKEFQGEL